MTSAAVARPRAFWADIRFLLGVVLVIVSIVGVWLVVDAARHTVPVLAADRTIVVGEPLRADDLRVVDVALGSQVEAYVPPGSLAPGAVAARTIGDGELVPAAAVAAPDDLGVTTIVVTVTQGLPAALAEGASVEVWHAPQSESGVFDDPRVLVGEATVRAVHEPEGVMAAGSASVELVLDRGDVAAALGAIARGDSISVVPTGAL
ncbi:SAF domain-containing protein [Microbacterium thalli]|uniref:SAF domain-containing protein n=1 Tax=Microbacterium thalli TaxID=3027921 RepID=A0ABT5SI66_9MICO|nr:SAF domain-containing protein [Microbacterium thalli]MDD7962195.1 SAF domain-containing protein [Microbacterium thalli]